jgi:hypothetical protein
MDFQQERFGKDAAAYDERIQKLYPFYETIHPAINAILRGLLGRERELLIVAAGTGAEILELGKTNPGWRFFWRRSGRAHVGSREGKDRSRRTI